MGASGALGPRGESEDGGDVAEVAGLVAATGELDGVADQAAGGGQGEGGEGGGGHEDGAAAAGEVEAGEAVDLGLPIGFFGEREVGGVGQGFGEGGVPLAGELGEQLVADAVAGEIEGGVGGVFAPGDGAVAEEAKAISGRSISMSGRTMPRAVTGRMAASPVAPVPRRKRKRTVSAWSERVWPRAMRVASPRAR